MMQRKQTMEFDFDFAERTLEAAILLGKHADGKNETARTVVYLSCLSMEISMKALLEQSGLSEPEIRKFSHRLKDLLLAIDSLQFLGERIRPQHRLWSQRVSSHVNGSVGLLLSEAANGSVYPNQIRYGEQVACIEPMLMLNMAKVVLAWCNKNAGHLNYSRPQSA